MKVFVQYLNEDGSAPCGDRAVVVLDGRRSLSGMIFDAQECNGVRRPLYPHFQIHRGTFRRSTVIYDSRTERAPRA